MPDNELLDKVNRARQMEEEMAGMLIDLCTPASPVEDIDPGSLRAIRQILLAIKNDTLRHKEMLVEITQELSRG